VSPPITRLQAGRREIFLLVLTTGKFFNNVDKLKVQSTVYAQAQHRSGEIPRARV
jgi:hypothetical protein